MADQPVGQHSPNPKYPPSRLRGLRQFKPGESGNARGRRPGRKTLMHAIERMANMNTGELVQMDPTRLKVGEAFIRSLWLKSLDERASYADSARQALLAYLVGKPTRVQTADEQRREWHLSFDVPDAPALPADAYRPALPEHVSSESPPSRQEAQQPPQPTPDDVEVAPPHKAIEYTERGVAVSWSAWELKQALGSRRRVEYGGSGSIP